MSGYDITWEENQPRKEVATECVLIHELLERHYVEMSPTQLKDLENRIVARILDALKNS